MWKPAKGSGKLARRASKDAKRIEREKQKKRDRLTKAMENRNLRFDVFTRDKGRCRAFGLPLYFEHSDPMQVGHCHHVIYRSAGGNDSLDNLLYLSWKAHQMVHDGMLIIHGDPNGLIYFTAKDRKGKVTRTWESHA
jgi:5-methylcytosine-specific restriction endonuclease McrA